MGLIEKKTGPMKMLNDTITNIMSSNQEWFWSELPAFQEQYEGSCFVLA